MVNIRIVIEYRKYIYNFRFNQKIYNLRQCNTNHNVNPETSSTQGPG
jgi:hypothetical protein